MRAALFFTKSEEGRDAFAFPVIGRDRGHLTFKELYGYEPSRNCGTTIALSLARNPTLKSLMRRFAVPASESQLALTLAVSLVMMAALLVCLLWQGNIISAQQQLIRALWTGR